jgi:hypothetical protein
VTNNEEWEVDGVYDQISAEMRRQYEKWGQQNHPYGTGPEKRLLARTDVNLDLRTGRELANIFRDKCKSNIYPHQDNWKDILLEEVFEALAEDHEPALRGELVQVAAVVVQWLKAIDRRREQEALEVAHEFFAEVPEMIAQAVEEDG